jgi:uncharacterized membrane protein YgcG
MKRSVRFLGPIGLLGVGLLIAAASAARAPDDTSAAQGATVSLVPSSQNVRSGDTFTIDVAAENVTNLAAFEFIISFDPDILSVGSIQESGFLGSTGRDVWCEGPITEPPYVSPGNVRFGCSTVNIDTARPAGSGALATVTFVAIGEGVSPLTFGMVQLGDEKGYDCCNPITVREAAVRVLGPDDPTPESLPPTPTRNPRGLTPTPIPGAPTPRSGPLLPGSEYQVPGGTASGAGGTSGSSSGASGGGTVAGGGAGAAGEPGASPRAGSGPPAEETPWWPILASALLAVGGATLLSLAAYARRVGMRRRT